MRFNKQMKFQPSFADAIARYNFASKYCYKRKVLDAGCQRGYGGNLLSYVSTHIGFADISEKSLGYCKRLVHQCASSYYQVDFEKERIPEKWDTIVSFETIEHLEDPDFYLDSVKEALNDGGYLIFSVPHETPSSLHKQIFNEQAIRELIEKHFTLEALYLQDRKQFSNEPNYKGQKYYLGVAKKR
jgi:2-polyprenyl-3-methyl-5-hydroxy-6-metoxy-1,4-benzoquinol methylase